jgi:hypothetical protein
LATTGTYDKNLANSEFYFLKIWQIWVIFFNEKSLVWVEIVFFRSKFGENLAVKP